MQIGWEWVGTYPVGAEVFALRLGFWCLGLVGGSWTVRISAVLAGYRSTAATGDRNLVLEIGGLVGGNVNSWWGRFWSVPDWKTLFFLYLQGLVCLITLILINFGVTAVCKWCHKGKLTAPVWLYSDLCRAESGKASSIFILYQLSTVAVLSSKHDYNDYANAKVTSYNRSITSQSRGFKKSFAKLN